MVTIEQTPMSIDSSAQFTVTTSLVEDASHNNLRLKAQVYFEGSVIAVLEKPKGLSVFDFSEILKTKLYGFKKERNTADKFECGSVGPELITDFILYNGYFDVLTKTGNMISSAISSGDGSLTSNSIPMLKGETYVFTSYDFGSAGVNRPEVRLSETGGSHSVPIYENTTYLFTPTVDNTYMTVLLGLNAAQNFWGTMSLKKITTDRATVGQLLVPYFVKFTETYEDANGVTQEYYTDKTVMHRYVAASPVINFLDYLLINVNSKFANNNFREGVVKYYSADNTELRLVFFTDRHNLGLERELNGTGGFTVIEYPFCYEGWGVVILNNLTLAGITSQVKFRINNDLTAVVISETMTIVNDTVCNNARLILECTGFTGGLEAFPFSNLPNGRFVVDRVFYTRPEGGRKPVSFKGVSRYTLRTQFVDMYHTDFLIALLLATDVKCLRPSAEPIDVTVVSDTGLVSSDEMFLNDIEIEFDYGY